MLLDVFCFWAIKNGFTFCIAPDVFLVLFTYLYCFSLYKRIAFNTALYFCPRMIRKENYALMLQLTIEYLRR